MSEENVRLVERIQEILSSTDIVADLLEDAQETREEFAALAEPDFECIMLGPEYAVARFDGQGFEGFRKIWLEWVSPFDSFRVDVEEVVDVGDRVLSLVRLTGLTKTGAVEVESPAAAVWTIRAGKLTRVEFHLDRDAAKRAAGLEP